MQCRQSSAVSLEIVVSGSCTESVMRAEKEGVWLRVWVVRRMQA
jgi:hypothetical protein